MTCLGWLISRATIRAKSRWTASLLLAPFIRLQHWNWFFCWLWDGIVTQNYCCIKMQFPLPTPVSMLCSIVESVPVWYDVNQHWNEERGRSVVITPQWSNTFRPDCSLWLLQVGSNGSIAFGVLQSPVHWYGMPPPPFFFFFFFLSAIPPECLQS